MKYIDAEKLIERLEEMKRAEYENCGGVNSKTGALQEVQELIASLQQEQPEVDLKKEYAEFVEADPVYSKLVNDVVGRAIARHFAEWGAIHLNARKEE